MEISMHILLMVVISIWIINVIIVVIFSYELFKNDK